MSTLTIVIVVAVYFLVLLLISYSISRKTNNDTFFRGNKQSPWYAVSFGMIGASLSGITFISIPGVVGSEGMNSSLSYMQMTLGFVAGYIVIANVLLPIYYKLKLTSIYTYLEKRLGAVSHLTGASLFMISRIIVAAFRLFVSSIVVQRFIMDPLGVPFYYTAMITILMIWLYTFRGGIKTIVWTDILQTSCMLIALVVSMIVLSEALGLHSISATASAIAESKYSKIFFFDDGWSNGNYFWKQFLSGMFICIVMTGLDQDMMQKNLTCRTLKASKKNMISLGLSLIPVNLLFLSLGILLYLYMEKFGISIPADQVGGQLVPRYDLVFPNVILPNFSPAVGIVFLLGIIAASYSSVDSAITSLTTSFYVDFMKMDKKQCSDKFNYKRSIVHFGFSSILFLLILLFWYFNDLSAINLLYKMVSYTYGPLLGLFAFGLFTQYKVKDRLVPLIVVIAPILTYLFNIYSEELLSGYKAGFEILIINGLFTFILLSIFRRQLKSKN